MIEKIKLFIEKRKVLLTTLSYVAALLYVTTNPIIGWLVFYIPIVIYSIAKIRVFKELKNKWFSVLLTTGGLFFFGKIMAEKILHLYYAIYVDYIGNSVVILGVMIAIIVWMIIYAFYYLIINLILMYTEGFIMIIKDIIKFFEKIFGRKLSSSNKYVQWLQLYKETFDGMTIMVALGILISCFWLLFNLNSIFPYILLSDVYVYSDCSKEEQDQKKFYVKKNDKECYQVKFEIPPVYLIKPIPNSNFN